MNHTELFIHTDGATEPQRLTFPEGVTIEEIIVTVLPNGHQDFLLFLEEEVEPKARHHHLHEAGIHHGHHVHIRHKHHPRPHHPVTRQVEVTINGDKYATHSGSNEVEHLRKIGKVPPNDIFAEFKGGQFDDLANNARVEIRGGELFASHVKSAGSS